MPVADNRAGFKRRRRDIANPYQAQGGKQHHQGHNGVNRNAQRATVGIAAGSVVVRNLDDGQQGQQHKAHHGSHPQTAGPVAALDLEMRLSEMCSITHRCYQGWLTCGDLGGAE
jgi:hypothetical protein